MNVHKKHSFILISIFIAAMFILTCTMIICATGGVTYAADDNAGYVVTVKVGETQEQSFESIAEAFDYANGLTTDENNFAEITLLTNVTSNGILGVAADQYITLDLNGCMFKFTSGYLRILGNLTLTDKENPTAADRHYYTVTDTHWIFSEDGEGAQYIDGGVICGGDAMLSHCVFVDGGTFTMERGNICGNAVLTGTVVVANNSKFTMNGGRISGNYSNGDGGGVCVMGGMFKVSGAVNITGNKKNGTDNNVYLASEPITVAGALEKSGKKAQIGVTYFDDGAGEIATGFTGENGLNGKKPSNYFIPDNKTYNCVYVSDETSGTVSIGTHNYVDDICTQCKRVNYMCWGTKEGTDSDGNPTVELILSSDRTNPDTPNDYATSTWLYNS